MVMGSKVEVTHQHVGGACIADILQFVTLPLHRLQLQEELRRGGALNNAVVTTNRPAKQQCNSICRIYKSSVVPLSARAGEDILDFIDEGLQDANGH